MSTAKSAAWCPGCGGPGAEMVGLCGSAQRATPSPGAPLQAPHLQRSPSQPSFQVLPREAGAQRPGVGRSLQVWNLNMRSGLRRRGCPVEWDPHQSPSCLQEKTRKRMKMRVKRRCSVIPAHGPTAPPQTIVTQMPSDHTLSLSPRHLRRKRHLWPLQLPPLLLLCQPHQHPHWVLELFCL